MAVGELLVSIIGDMQGLSKTFSQVQTELDGVGSKISSVGQNMSSAGMAMTTGITGPLIAAGAGIAAVTSQAVDFEQGMAKVFTLLPNASKASMGAMSEDVKNFSMEMGVTTDQVLPALYDAIGSGVPEENVFSFLEIAQKGAVAGATEIGVAVDTLTSVTNAYGVEALSAGEASDIMFAGINVGKMSYEELQKSLYEVVPTAASLGVSFEDVTAALAAMTAQGTPTTVATAQLRQLFVELSKEGTVASDTFKELSGKSFYEFIQSGGTVQEAVQMLSDGMTQAVPDAAELQKAMFDLADPTSGLALEFEKLSGKTFKEFQQEGGTAEEALKMLGVGFGDTKERVSDYFGSVEAGNAILNLSGQGAEIYAGTLEAVGNSAGATDQAFAKMSDTSQRSIDNIKAKIDVLAVTLGSQFLPILEDTIVPLIENSIIPAIEAVIPIVASVAEAFSSLSPTVQTIIIAFIALVAALGPILIVAGAVVSAVGTLVGAFGGISAVVTTVIGVFSTFGTAIVSLLGGPLTIIIALIAAFALAWSQNWFGIRDKTAVVIAAIKTAFEQFKTNLKVLWDLIVNIVKTDAGLIVSAAQGLYNGLVSVYNSIKTSLSGLYTSLVASWNNIKTAISQATAAIITTLQTWYTNLQARFTQVKTAIQGLIIDWSAKWNSFKTTASNLANQIVSVLQTWYTSVQARFTQVKTACSSILASWNTHWNNFKSATTSAASALNSALSTMYSYVQAKFTQIKTAASGILTAWKTHWNNFVSNTKTAASNITSALASMLSSITTKFNNIKSAASTFLNTWKTHWTNFVSATKTASSNAVSALTSMLSSIKSKFDSIISAASNLLSSWKSKWNDVVSSTKSAGSKVVSAVSGIADDVKGLVSNFTRAGAAIMDALYDSITSGFKKAIKKAKDSLKELKSYLPSSPAKQGPFSTLPNWDTVFVDPLSASIQSIKSLSEPLKSSLSGLRNPIDSSISRGLNSIQNVSNVNTDSSVSAGDTNIYVGPVSLSNSVDLQALVTEINKISADQRRQRGVFL